MMIVQDINVGEFYLCHGIIAPDQPIEVIDKEPHHPIFKMPVVYAQYLGKDTMRGRGPILTIPLDSIIKKYVINP